MNSVLIVSSRFPYPTTRGDAMTLYQLALHMNRVVPVHLAVLSDESPSEGARRVVSAAVTSLTVESITKASGWARALTGLASPQPSQILYYRTRRMAGTVARLVKSIGTDVLLCHGIRMAQYVVGLPVRVKNLLAVDSIGLELRGRARCSPWWQRWSIEREADRVDRYTADIARSFAKVIVCAETDARDLERLGCENVAVVRHGISFDPLAFPRRRLVAPTAVFTGNLSIPHNVDAVRYITSELWPRVRAAIPSARLRIAGASPSVVVRRACAEVGAELIADPSSIASIIAEADVVLAPMRYGTGTQNKVLEGLALGVPVVTTPTIAAGFDADVRAAIAIGATSEDLAVATIRILENRKHWDSSADRTATTVRRRYDWNVMVQAILDAEPNAGAANVVVGR